MARAPIVKERAPGEGRNSRTPEKKCGGARRGNEALACARLWFQRWARATRRARAWRLRAFAGGRSGKAAESDGGDTPRRPRRPCIVETPACTGGLGMRAKGRTRQRASGDYKNTALFERSYVPLVAQDILSLFPIEE